MIPDISPTRPLNSPRIKQNETITITKVRTLDTVLAENRKSMRNLIAELKEDDKKQNEIRNNIIAIANSFTKKKQESAVIAVNLEQQKSNEALVEKLEGLRHQITGTVELDKQIGIISDSQTKTAKSIESFDQQLHEKEQTCQVAQTTQAATTFTAHRNWVFWSAVKRFTLITKA